MTRLVILARKLDPGGAERQLVALGRGLKQRGHDVHVVLFYTGGVFDAELAHAGVPIHCLGKTLRWDVPRFLFRLAATLRRLRPDVIYSFLDMPNVLAVLLHHIAGRPRLVWSIRAAGMEMHHYDWLSRTIPWLESRLSGWADAIIANSHAGAEWAVYRGFPAGRLRVVENGIDTQRFRPGAAARVQVRTGWGVSDDDRLIGMVGRVDPMKDHMTFLQAAARVAEVRTDARFVCVGAGAAAYQNALQWRGAELGLAEKLIWAGARQDMPEVYNALDVFTSSSSFGEGFSNVIGEAMACGVPCVVTDVGDSVRIVGDLGDVVPPRDADALAKALMRMLERIEQEPDLGRRVHERIESEFSVERMVVRTERLLFGPA